MKKFMKRSIALLLAGALCLGLGVTAFAEEPTADIEDIVVDAGDKPYVALGEDLTSDQKATVLALMGITEEDLEGYDVVYITNEQEHKYLDSYISSSVIGTKALSSVLVMEGKKGSGINVVTKNISYCTSGMYENALATAGLKDAEVIVVGPTSISGTSALIGAIEAYSVMSGKKVDMDIIDGAVNEIITTGQLEEAIQNSSPEEVEGMIAYLKDQLKDMDGLSDAELAQRVRDAATEFNVVLSDDEVAQIVALLKKLQGLNLDWDKIGDQALKLYEKLRGGEIDVDKLMKTFNGVTGNGGDGFFAKLVNTLKGLFKR